MKYQFTTFSLVVNFIISSCHFAFEYTHTNAQTSVLKMSQKWGAEEEEFSFFQFEILFFFLISAKIIDRLLHIRSQTDVEARREKNLIQRFIYINDIFWLLRLLPPITCEWIYFQCIFKLHSKHIKSYSNSHKSFHIFFLFIFSLLLLPYFSFIVQCFFVYISQNSLKKCFYTELLLLLHFIRRRETSFCWVNSP
jgi:hypothetical protein